jgi:hypothetical protein
MAYLWRDRLKVTVSNTPGTGAFTVSTPSSGYQGFVAGDDGKVGFYVAEEGTAWESFIGTYTHGTTSLARTQLIDSSSGSAVSFTSAAVVWLDLASAAAYSAHMGGKGVINGGLLIYNSATALDIEACTLSVNRKILSASATTITSGSTMLDISGATVTLAASKCYFVFAYDNSGTLAYRVEERDGTGDGADPTWDVDYDYWKATSTGVAARRIGKFWTDSSGNIRVFTMIKSGIRDRKYYSNTASHAVLVNAGALTSFTSLTITPYSTTDDTTICVAVRVGRVSSTGGAQGQLSIDGTQAALSCRFENMLAGGISDAGLRHELPYTGLLYYNVTGANQTCTVWINGSGFIV